MPSAPYEPPEFLSVGGRSAVTCTSHYVEYVVAAQFLVVAVALVAGIIGTRPWGGKLLIPLAAVALLPVGCTAMFWAEFCPNHEFPVGLIEPLPDGAAVVGETHGGYTCQGFVLQVDASSSLAVVEDVVAHYESLGWRVWNEPHITRRSGNPTGSGAGLFAGSNEGAGWSMWVSAREESPGEVVVGVEVPNQSGLCG